ncbi:MAG: pyridoxine 5'-phosphate synthase [Methyloligellaceae bacterium]
MSSDLLRLGVNIDHVATVRNARGVNYPDPVRAALLAIEAGADGITAHLREDRRHIRDDDIVRLKQSISKPLNFEMAATDEMLQIALQNRPNACCIVPEKREELTTEGGLNVTGNSAKLREIIKRLKGEGIRASLFIDPDEAQIDMSAELGADIVELHTGTYCHAGLDGDKAAELAELDRIIAGASQAAGAGLEVHAGHGLTFENVKPVASIPQVVELNIGHFLIAESIFDGMQNVVMKFKQCMDEARR